ncbi:MAG: hypothetical protein FD180_1419 [Planctomycetota bacterium]|nr:MAG: hypothetical protein FD180_1419 [Planctomycetota bacterium]
MHRTAVALLLTLLAGCLAKDYPDRHLHVIGAERPGEAADGPNGAILAVKPFTINSRYEGAEFVYRKSDTTWETDYYETFFVPPREMVTDAARTWLARAGIFENVTGLSSTAPPTHILEGHVTQLWIDSRESTLKACVEVQFVLVDQGRTPAKVLFKESYTKLVDLPSDTPEDAVRAWGAGLADVLQRLEKDIRGVVLMAVLEKLEAELRDGVEKR